MKVKNGGESPEPFVITASYTPYGEYDPLIGVQNVTLSAGANATLTFPWTPPTSLFFEVKAEMARLPDEFDLADNALTQQLQTGSGGSGGRMPYLR